MEETGIPEENHRSAASHLQTLSHISDCHNSEIDGFSGVRVSQFLFSVLCFVDLHLSF
jgi:hypothetical protein